MKKNHMVVSIHREKGFDENADAHLLTAKTLSKLRRWVLVVESRSLRGLSLKGILGP
jgi:hypothetical protein